MEIDKPIDDMTDEEILEGLQATPILAALERIADALECIAGCAVELLEGDDEHEAEH